ncbi:MAG: hypothetical protein U1A27_13250 [Phycisphaerae bacterium]
MRPKQIQWFLMAVAGAALLAGCEKSAPTPPPASASGAADAASVSKLVTAGAGAVDEAISAKLAAADALDGKADHVIEKCPGCALAMGGSAKHEFSFGGYQLHFCSDDCMKGFTREAAQSLAKLEIPKH